MMNRENKRPVTLEDLLRLKRTERPPAEFWNQFDRELRAKQLAAIVEKRPWWRRLPQAFAGFTRYQLPLGATAALALTFLIVREYRHAEPAVASEAVVTSAAPATHESASVVASNLAAMRREVAAPAVAHDMPAATLVLATPTATPNHLSQVVPLTGVDSLAENSERDLTPAASFIATNLALAKATEPGVAQNMLGASRGFETRAMPARTPAIDPLAQMTSPADARRSRLLAGFASAVSINSVPVARTTEVRPRHLSDEQLYETVSRFGARGATAGFVKF